MADVLKTAAKVLLLVAFIGGIYFLALYPRYARKGIYRDRYEGQVLEKWVSVIEGQQGSKLQGRLLVESDSGERLEVVVGRDTYERAQPGMRIRRNGGGVELWWPGTAQHPAAEGRR